MHNLYFSYQIIRWVSSESVAAVKGIVRLYYERFPSLREKKKKCNKKEK